MNSLKNKSSKILVLTVDLDDDLGRIGISTPIIGIENVLNTAIHLGINDPNNPDLNAIFQAIKIYNDFKNNGRDVEIAIVTGKYGDTSFSAIKVYEELERLRNSIGFEYIYFVSDGAYDEQIIPVLQSVSRVIGVNRVIVTQSRGIEETYLLIGRYLKKAFMEQPYTKFFLGIPGLIMILYVIATVIGLTRYLWEIIVLIIGIILFVKGFGFIDKAFDYSRKSIILGLIYSSALVLISYSMCVSIVISIIFGLTTSTFKLIVNTSLFSFIAGFILLIVCRIFDKVIENRAHLVWRDALLLIPIVFFIIFTVNLYQRLVISENSLESEELITIIFKHDVFIPFISAIISIIVFSILFVILDHFILKKSTTKPSLS